MKRLCFFLALFAVISGGSLGIVRGIARRSERAILALRTHDFGSPLRSRLDVAWRNRCPAGDIAYHVHGFWRIAVTADLRCGHELQSAVFEVAGSDVKPQNESARALISMLSKL